MPQPFPDTAAMERFLAEPRLAILMTNRSERAPMGVPVWFEWADGEVRMFAARGSAKLNRLARDPKASVLVTNRVGEPEAWVAFDGEVAVEETDVCELLGRLGARYWDLNDPKASSTLESWIAAPDAFAALTLRPDRIRTGQ